MTAEPRPRAYILHYTWPYRLIGPLLVVLGVAYPLLLHYVESRRIEGGDWMGAFVMMIVGVLVGIHHGRTVSVSPDAIDFRGPIRHRHLPWNRVARLETTDDKFVLISTSGERYAVAMEMDNRDRFAQELDARFDSNGLRLEC